MKFVLDDFVPTELSDAQKKATICDWFVREKLNFAECFIRAELNHVPFDTKVTIEKPVDKDGLIMGFADIFIRYNTPKKLKKVDENGNKILALRSKINYNRIIRQSALKELPKTNNTYDREMSLKLHSINYEASYLLKKELELCKESNSKYENEIHKLMGEAIGQKHGLAEKQRYKKTELVEEKLLITVIPSIEFLKADINSAIRNIKTIEFYMGNITRKAIVYWGINDSDIGAYLEHENIKLFGLNEMMYYKEESLQRVETIEELEKED
jgi:hypothetical protein